MELEPRVGRWLALRRVGLGSFNFATLIEHFGSIEEAWDAPFDELRRAGIERPYALSVVRARTTLSESEELELVAKAGARAVTWLDAAYPPRLREIPQSPPVLVVRGNGDPGQASAVAVVGTRRVTSYGRRVAETFCRALCQANVAIVSGLAKGVDAIAHRAAIDAGTCTVGVLAGGLDEIYPREHTSLAAQIEEQGCILSEYPIGIPARPDYFPRRNRILSGLSRATIVIEAGEGSGALHTANWAFEQGREVYAVPGSIFSAQSVACHKLVRDNVATLVTDPAQVLADLDIQMENTQCSLPLTPPETEALAGPPLGPQELAILAAIGDAAQHIDALARELEMPIERLSSSLTLLELQGAVRQTGPMTYQLTPRGRA